MRKKNGITLIALIITIVLLIIIAVVAISSVKDEGIVNNANKVAKEWEQKSENEKELINKILDGDEEEACKHNWVYNRTITEATCTTNGKEEQICTLCGETKNVSIQALGHDIKETTITQANCKYGKIVMQECQRENCDYAQSSETTSPDYSKHEYTKISTTSNKYINKLFHAEIAYQCSVCEKNYRYVLMPHYTTINYNGGKAVCTCKTASGGEVSIEENANNAFEANAQWGTYFGINYVVEVNGIWYVSDNYGSGYKINLNNKTYDATPESWSNIWWDNNLYYGSSNAEYFDEESINNWIGAIKVYKIIPSSGVTFTCSELSSSELY